MPGEKSGSHTRRVKQVERTEGTTGTEHQMNDTDRKSKFSEDQNYIPTGLIAPEALLGRKEVHHSAH